MPEVDPMRAAREAERRAAKLAKATPARVEFAVPEHRVEFAVPEHRVEFAVPEPPAEAPHGV